jgi:hypothetical protein
MCPDILFVFLVFFCEVNDYQRVRFIVCLLIGTCSFFFLVNARFKEREGERGHR